MKVIAALVLLVACAGHDAPAPSCVIEDVVADRMTGVDHVDCGQLAAQPTSIDEAAYRAAHDCVAAAMAANEYFSVIWDKRGRDSRIAGAYLGVPLDGGRELQSLYFDSDPSGGSQIGEVTGTSHCDGLTDLGACPDYDLQSKLCFDCAGVRGLAQCNAAD